MAQKAFGLLVLQLIFVLQISQITLSPAWLAFSSETPSRWLTHVHCTHPPQV